MAVRGKLHTPAVLPLGKEPPCPMDMSPGV